MKLPEATMLLIALLPALADGAEAGAESAAKARARAAQMDKILLTAPKFDPAGQRVARPITFRTKRFTLRFSATGVPVSLKRLSDGKELLDQGTPSMGFYLRGFDDRITKLRNLARRPDGSYVVSNGNNTQRVVFAVAERDRYLTIRLKEFYGIPKRVHLDRNWKKIKDLPAKLDNYVMGKGYHRVWLTADGPKTWAFVRFSTEGEPMTVPRP